jgi:chromosome segregation ATPase
MIEEKLKELEGRVKAVVALVEKVKEEKALLEQRVAGLQGIIKEQADRMKAVEAGRKKDQQQLSRIVEEREEVRLRVDHLLEEIARIEASVEPGP